MKARRLIVFIIALNLLLSTAVSVHAAQTDTSDLVKQMLNYYQHHQGRAETDIARLTDQLTQIDTAQGEAWNKIMDYWIWVNESTDIGSGVLPDGLPNDNSLCIVVLGYALNADGSMQSELIGRLEAALASAEKYPNAYIACTGGSTARKNASATEAGQMARWLTDQGIDKSRIIIENSSLTTVQNAQFTCRVIAEKYPEIQHLALVTSDYHLNQGCMLFYTESILHGYALDILGNAAYDTGHVRANDITLQASSMAQLAGISLQRLEKPALSRLTGISVSGETVYAPGSELNLTVTAAYDTNFSRDVTASAVFSEIDFSRPGQQTVTVSYTENGFEETAGFEIEILPAATESPTETPEVPAVELPKQTPPARTPWTDPFLLIPLGAAAGLLILLIILLWYWKTHDKSFNRRR